MVRRSLVIAALLAAPEFAFGQQLPPVAPGDRVRVTTADAGTPRYRGTVIAAGHDTLVVDSLRFPLSTVTRLDISRGRTSRTGRGALIGGAVGVIAGGLAGFAFGGLCYIDTVESEAQECQAASTVIGAVGIGAAGALLGALLGSVTKSERWEEVRIAPFQARVVPARVNRTALVFSMDF